jgi:hypothetical protein
MNENTQLLISEAIKNSLSDLNINDYADNFIFSEILIQVGDAVESINSSLSEVQFLSEKTHLEVKVLYEDAIGLSEAWTSIKIKEFSFSLGKEKIIHNGPFEILSFGIKKIEPEQRMCVIVFDLRSA